MKEYFSVNRHKFLRQFIVTSVIFTIVWTFIILTDKKGMNIETKILGYFLFAIPLAFFGQFVMNIRDALEFKRINKIFDHPQLNKFTSTGFIKTLSEKDSKWLSSKPILKGTIDNYPVKFEVEKGILRVIAETNLDLVEKTHIQELKSIFGKDNIEYDIGIALLFRPARRKDLSFQDINSELIKFISFLKTNKLDAWVENGNA
ncbi:MAG: hypothetical protein JNK50_13640 [Bacteroidia bacterium]|nr:hypothetical protein [Bacteroidia bacterium]